MPLFEAALPRMRCFLTSASGWRADILNIGPDNPPEPRWNQDWFPRLDALAAYVMVRRAQPARIVEVGAGHSTRFLARAIRDGHLATRLTSLDPQPRATLSGFDVLTKPLQDIPLSLFGSLRIGDILFVDSSHVLAPGSDVARLMGHILPPLPSGLLVHFHDIFLPNDYPSDWAHRRYNEQSAVAGLLSSGDWQIEFSSAHAVRRLGDAIAQSVAGELPLIAGARESSLWLRKR
ncbi:MAG: class I SAM-dependent methyltransferase [Alphaproteobacteria bacterium]|jgi:hypothetical protein|nr:class I SAM-dependent methyltransferase [Alphaproteobacteria bacterium]